MKANKAKIQALLRKLSVEVLGKPMTAKDEARFARQLRKAQRKSAA